MKYKIIAVLILIPFLYLTFHDFLLLSTDTKILRLFALFLCGILPFFMWNHEKISQTNEAAKAPNEK